MNLKQLFCPNIDCPARGQTGKEYHFHSQKEKRCLCSVCDKTFAITKGTLFYRLRTDPKIVMWVIVLWPMVSIQAIVKAFGFDERTVKNWWQRAGDHCENVHEHLIGQRQLDLQQVQADEIKAKIQGGTWLAMAIMVSTRFGWVVSSVPDGTAVNSLWPTDSCHGPLPPLVVGRGWLARLRQSISTRLSQGAVWAKRAATVLLA